MATQIECTPLSKETIPTHLTLATLHKELNTHAMAISSHRGGGAHGHLALVLTAPDYLALTNVPFVIPVHPGINPPVLANATVAQITENNRVHAAALVDHELYHKTDRKLKDLLLKAVPAPFIQQLQDIRFGYSQIRTTAILEHLDTTYGTVTHDDLKANIANMDKQWTGEQPMEDLWGQINQAKQYAAGHDDISDKQALRSAENNLEQSGLFVDDFKTWNKLTTANQTLAAFITHFNQANKARLKHKTTVSAGYNATTTTGRNAPAPTPTDANKENKKQGTIQGWHYCWSHGVNKTHDSQTCTYPKDNHNKSATINKPQGGSVYIQFPKDNRRNRNQPTATTTPPTIA
jgi:hypothetical protein